MQQEKVHLQLGKKLSIQNDFVYGGFERVLLKVGILHDC